MEKPQLTSEWTKLIAQNKAIHEEVQELKGKEINYPYEADELPRGLARLQQVYRSYLSLHGQVADVREEHVYSITLRGLTKSVTVPLAEGSEAICQVVESMLAERLDAVVNKLESMRAQIAQETPELVAADVALTRYQQLLLAPWGQLPELSEE